jgi:dolichol-phosphate mannosyltransferase
MAVLFALADAPWLGWNVTVSKLCSAEIALLHNFVWNELWTFRRPGRGREPPFSRWRRLLHFHAICGVGIGIAAVVLRVLYNDFAFNLYVANLLAIIAATLWNFWMNARLNWQIHRR